MASDELARVPTEWTDESRLEAARVARTSRRWNEQIASEASTFSGLLLDLYETATTVQIQVAHRRQHSGVIVEVGRDFVTVAAPQLSRSILPLRSIGSIQVSSAVAQIGSVSDRETAGTTLVDTLAHFAAGRIHVRYLTITSDQVRSGTITSVGADLITIALDADSGTVFVPVDQLTEVTVG
jgi:hypothetical protein